MSCDSEKGLMRGSKIFDCFWLIQHWKIHHRKIFREKWTLLITQMARYQRGRRRVGGGGGGRERGKSCRRFRETEMVWVMEEQKGKTVRRHNRVKEDEGDERGMRFLFQSGTFITSKEFILVFFLFFPALTLSLLLSISPPSCTVSSIDQAAFFYFI